MGKRELAGSLGAVHLATCAKAAQRRAGPVQPEQSRAHPPEEEEEGGTADLYEMKSNFRDSITR